MQQEVTARGQTDAGLHTCYGDKRISFLRQVELECLSLAAKASLTVLQGGSATQEEQKSREEQRRIQGKPRFGESRFKEVWQPGCTHQEELYDP